MEIAITRNAGFLLPTLALGAVLAAALFPGCSTAPPPKTHDLSAADIEAAFRKFEEAWEREDVDTATSAFTPDAVVFDPVPPGRFEKTQEIRAWISGSFDALDQISIDMTQSRIQTLGPVAWGTAHYVFAAQQGGKPVRFEGDLTTVWVRQTDGSPRMSVFHASHLPPAGGG